MEQKRKRKIIDPKIAEQMRADFWTAPDNALFPQLPVAVVRGCSESTMEHDRWAGTGIPFIKVGRKTLYRKGTVVEWLNQQPHVRSTSEYLRVLERQAGPSYRDTAREAQSV